MEEVAGTGRDSVEESFEPPDPHFSQAPSPAFDAVTGTDDTIDEDIGAFNGHATSIRNPNPRNDNPSPAARSQRCTTAPLA